MNTKHINERFEAERGPIVRSWEETQVDSLDGTEYSITFVEHADGFKRVYDTSLTQEGNQ